MVILGGGAKKSILLYATHSSPCSNSITFQIPSYSNDTTVGLLYLYFVIASAPQQTPTSCLYVQITALTLIIIIGGVGDTNIEPGI